MLKICSWCQSPIGWDADLKGESHGICQACLRKFFPLEAVAIISRKNRR